MEKTEAELDLLVDKFSQAALADATKATYKSQLTSFLSFCNNYGYTAIPASTLTLCRYVAFLSSRLKCNSIHQYLNAVRLLHVHNGFSNPLDNNIRLRAVLKGLQRVMGRVVSRKSPITVDILLRIRQVLQLSIVENASFWASCLIAFYGMLRKSSVFPPKGGYLKIHNVHVYKWGVILVLNYSKTVQCKERQHSIPLPWSKQALLCPARALLYAWKKGHCSSATDPMLPVVLNNALIPYTRHSFDNKLRSIMSQLGLVGYSGHSFRRGGASHALRCGVPAEIIMAQGDWRSLAYLDYLDVDSVATRASFIKYMYN
jgi:integrase